VPPNGIEQPSKVGRAGRDVTEVREQIRTLLGEIKLVRTPEGHLEAELVGRYAGW